MRLHMPHLHMPHLHRPHFHMTQRASWIAGIIVILGLIAAFIALMLVTGGVPMYGVPYLHPVLIPAL